MYVTQFWQLTWASNTLIHRLMTPHYLDADFGRKWHPAKTKNNTRIVIPANAQVASTSTPTPTSTSASSTTASTTSSSQVCPNPLLY